MMTKAFAYVHDNGAVEVATVASNVQGVEVNALFFLSRGKVRPMNDWTTEMIHARYEQMMAGRGRIAKVEINVMLDA